MGIADFFRPKYKHSDVKVRGEAVRALTSDDAATLIQIARTDRDIGVRRIAIEKIDSADVLADLAAHESERSLKAYAGERAARLWMAMACGSDGERATKAVNGMIELGDQSALVEVVARAESPAIKKRAFGELRDPRALAELAKRDIASELRLGAVARIDDGDVLRALAIDTTNKEVGLAAVEKLEDVDRLENVALRAKNKAVKKKASKVVAEIKAAEQARQKPVVADDVKRRRAEKTQLVREVEGLAETFDFAKGAPAMKAAEAAWAALGDGQDEIDPRFATAVARFWKRKDHHEAQARSTDELRVIEREAREARDRAAAERAAQAPAPVAPPREPEPVDPAREAEAKAQREERERLKAEDDARRAAQAEERALRQKADAERAVQIAESLEAMIVDLEKLAAEDHKDTRTIDRALAGAGKAFDQIGKAAPDKRDGLATRYQAVRGKLATKAGELREAEDWLRWSNVPKAEAMIATAKEWLDAPTTPDLGNRLRGLQALWKEVGPMPQRRSKELWDQFKAACDLVYDKVRAERAVAAEGFGEVAKKKEALIAEAETLAESTDWATTAERLKALQTAWKTSGHLPRKQGDDLWKRFRAACDKFFERRKPLLEARANEEMSNLAAKQALIARANVIADGAPGVGGWGKAITEIKRLQDEWKTIGYVPRRDADAIYKQFRTACDRLFAKRDEARDGEANAHRAELETISTELAAVTAAPDVARAIAVRDKAAEHPQFVSAVDDMLRAVIAALPDAVKGTAIDPQALRSKREKLIARAEELVPRKTDTPVAGAGDVAAQLAAAMRRNAFGDLRFGTRDPLEVVAELRASWAESGPFLDDADRAQTARFEATIAKITGEPSAVPSAVPIATSDATTSPAVAVPEAAIAAAAVAVSSGIPRTAHDAPTSPAFAPGATPEVDAGWDLGDADPTATAEDLVPLPAVDPRAAAPQEAAFDSQVTAPIVAKAEPMGPVKVAEKVTEPPPSVTEDATKEAPAPEETPSSSEMAGDGAVEGDGIDAGWD